MAPPTNPILPRKSYPGGRHTRATVAVKRPARKLSLSGDQHNNALWSDRPLPRKRLGRSLQSVREATKIDRSRHVRTGATRASDADTAVRELFGQIESFDTELIVFFCSAEYDLAAIEASIRRRNSPAQVIGCTSAGEITPQGYLSGTITGFSLSRAGFAAAATRIGGLQGFSLTSGHDTVAALRHRIRDAEAGGPDAESFAFLMADGESRHEDSLLSALYPCLGEIPLFGGTAGGTPDFRRSLVFHDGRFHRDCAVLVLIKTCHPFRLFTTSHFVPTEAKMVVTEADPRRRIVTEINAEPAGREYARMVGLAGERLTPMIFARHPVVVKVGGRDYVRSIQKVNDDESLSFFCAIDTGIVLTVARSTDIIEDLQRTLDELVAQIGPPQLTIGCDCILRGLELEEKQLKAAASRVLMRHNVVGMSTFGEQFHAMHVNQTFTGVAIGRCGG